MGLIFHSVKPLSLDHSDFQASCFQRGQVSVLRPRRSPCLYGGSGSAPAFGMLALKHSWVQRAQMVVIEIYPDLLHPSAVNLDPKGQMDTDGHCVLTTAALLKSSSQSCCPNFADCASGQLDSTGAPEMFGARSENILGPDLDPCHDQVLEH